MEDSKISGQPFCLHGLQLPNRSHVSGVSLHQPTQQSSVITHDYTTGTHPNKGLCGNCLAVRIHDVFTEAEHTTSRPVVRDHVHTITAVCDGCGKTTDTLDICYKPQCNIRFGTNWWNGHNMCEECLTDAPKHGKPTSGVYVWDHWHRYTVNSVGAAVTLDHWWTVLFPPKRKRHDEK